VRQAEIGTEQLQFLTANANISGIPLEEAIVPKRNEIVVSIAFVALILFLIFSSGTMLMQIALQERRDRMAEIMLSSLKPHQLMQGKIIGHFFLGLLQLTFWIGWKSFPHRNAHVWKDGKFYRNLAMVEI
jgi:ABC-2 type transport system permease protein